MRRRADKAPPRMEATMDMEKRRALLVGLVWLVLG